MTMSAAGRAVGIDIGGTKTAVATVTGAGEIVREATIPTEPGRGFASGVRRITDAVARILEESGWTPRDLDGVGVGCAGPVDSAGGIIRNPYTLSAWSGGDIVTPLREAFGCFVRLENDADMALLGECHAGAGRGFDAVVMLTFGTGIGGAALVGGSILRGAAGSHPDMGHVPVDPRGPRCYCGTSGCFESLASGSALSAAAAAHGLGDGRRLFERAREGDQAAEGFVRQALDATATATWTIVHMLMPQRLILGGGMMDEHYETFAAAAREAISRAAMPPPGGVSVARASLGNRAGIVGAASAVVNRQAKE
jgi:glucokinase